jgi:MSHA biogenesis protein MshJ
VSAANPLAAYWQRYLAWFAARQPRERLIVAAAVLGGIVFLGYSHAIEPAVLESRRTARSLAEAKAATAQAVAAAEALSKQNLDPDAPLRAELQRIQAQGADQAQRFEAVDRSLVPPAKVPSLLESLLRARTLQLVSLRTLPPAPVIERKAAKTEGAAAKAAEPAATDTALPNLFKHGVEIRIAGSYADLLGYLADLENAPQRLIWGRMDLSVAEYPRSVLTLTVYTLSLEKSWLVL